MQFGVVHSALASNIKTTPALKIVTPTVCAQLWWKFTQKVQFNTMQTSFCWAKEYLLLNVQKEEERKQRRRKQRQMKLERLREWTLSSNITCLLNMGEDFLFLQVHYLESLGLWWLALTCWCIYAIWDHCSRLLKHWKFASSFRIRTIKQKKKMQLARRY